MQTSARAGMVAALVFGGAAIGAGTARLVSAPMSRLQSRGAVLKGYRTAFGLTQAQLATMSHVAATRLSRLERGLDSASVALEDSIAAPLDSIFRARFHPDTELWLVQVVQRVRRRP